MVRNRHTWTVTTVTVTVTYPDRDTVELPDRYAAEHVELGLAVTGHGNEGDTVDIGLALNDEAGIPNRPSNRRRRSAPARVEVTQPHLDASKPDWGAEAFLTLPRRSWWK